MAEYYFNAAIKSRKNGGYYSESCGIYAQGGDCISEYAKICAGEASAKHKSRPVTEDIIKEAGIIYGVTKNHEAKLKEIYPGFSDKIFSMPENIGDPYGGTLEVYEKCFGNIKKSVDIIIKSLTEN